MASLRKRDVLSIVENPVRSNIIIRLTKAGKAAYSDLLDSAGPIEALDSRGNFNYHLNFLLENRIIQKEGMVYRLTDKGQAIAQFLREVDQAWKEIEIKMRGDHMSIVGYAEEFEKETGIKMQKAIGERKLKGRVGMIHDETNVIGILDEDECEDEFFGGYIEIPIDELKFYVDESEWKGEKHNLYVLGHTSFAYRVSPRLFGSVLQYMQRNYDEAHLLADVVKPMPFMIRAKTLHERYDGPAFMIAPITPGTFKKK